MIPSCRSIVSPRGGGYIAVVLRRCAARQIAVVIQVLLKTAARQSGRLVAYVVLRLLGVCTVVAPLAQTCRLCLLICLFWLAQTARLRKQSSLVIAIDIRQW